MNNRAKAISLKDPFKLIINAYRKPACDMQCEI